MRVCGAISSQTVCQIPVGARIPNRVRFELPVLLSARLGQVGRVVRSAHCQQMRPWLGQVFSDVDLERGVPPLMLGDQLVVNPDRRLVIDCAEMEDDPLGGASRDRLEGAPIPTCAMKPGIANPAGRGLGEKGTRMFRLEFQGTAEGASKVASSSITKSTPRRASPSRRAGAAA